MRDKIDMTPQEMFDKAVGGLIKQGRLAINVWGGCSYRTLDGDKCAFGQLIPDEVYTKQMEGISLTALNLSLGGLDTLSPLFKNNFTPEVIIFGADLQYIHDESRDFEEMIESYKDFAIERGLSLEIFDA